jgi:hypothetical protein
MPTPKDWSRDYFTKQADGKFLCNFGCGTKYSENVGKFKHHLLVSLCLFAIQIVEKSRFCRSRIKGNFTRNY